MTEDNGLLTRRTVLRSGAGAAALGAVGAGAMFYGSQPALASDHDEFNAGTVEVQANEDGEIEAVNIAPDVDIEWENFADGTATADLEIEVTVDPEGDDLTAEIYDTGVELEGESGSTTEDLEQEDITETDEIDEQDFPEGEETDVEIDITVTVDGEEDDNIDDEIVSEADAEFGVEVGEGAEITTVGGDANTDAE